MRFEDGSELVWRQYAQPDRQRIRDRLPKFELLSAIGRSDGAARCRALLAEQAGAIADRDLVERILQLVARERIWWLLPRHVYRPTGGFAAAAPPPPPAAPPSREPPSRAAALREQPAAEPGTFPDDVDQACLAATIAAASEDGVPLCEECLKK